MKNQDKILTLSIYLNKLSIMNNWNEELAPEEQAKIDSEMKMTDNELTDHQEVMDTFLKWDRSF
ncbi:hypothetical protein DMB65_05995 [Flavobacterium cheongpyeongense]|uniref:Uncharacterized protein n=1 Tax=Flavobacterium cheongpyeongense TaxID=2212651 RepID=A0A2V4BUG9_9FLAO|nr:hypothetical protein DMB65_05995 [Flavobacterium cheongpyeongense]